jgi:hypothetical protein
MSCAAATITTTTTTAATTPGDTGAAAWCGSLSGSLQRVIISWSAFSTQILWDWIHYAYARPAEWDSSLLRMNVLTDLLVPRWKPVDIEPMEDVTEVWKDHLKTNTSHGVPQHHLWHSMPAWHFERC